MINVWVPSQKEFNKYREDCRKLYENVQAEITDKNTFDFICRNTFFFLFETNDKLIGALYYFVKKDGKLYLNGFAKRKMHRLCLECLKMSLNWFRGRVYAEAQNKASALCLLRCGFTRIKDKLFVFNNNL